MGGKNMKDGARLQVLSNLKSKIRIERNSKVSDGCGGYEDNYTLVRECKASVKPLRAKETIIANSQVQQETTHTIIIRYSDKFNVQNSDTIVYKDKRFEITSVINIDNKNEFLELVCIERGN